MEEEHRTVNFHFSSAVAGWLPNSFESMANMNIDTLIHTNIPVPHIVRKVYDEVRESDNALQ
jgi:hypothetical protein